MTSAVFVCKPHCTGAHSESYGMLPHLCCTSMCNTAYQKGNSNEVAFFNLLRAQNLPYPWVFPPNAALQQNGSASGNFIEQN